MSTGQSRSVSLSAVAPPAIGRDRGVEVGVGIAVPDEASAPIALVPPRPSTRTPRRSRKWVTRLEPGEAHGAAPDTMAPRELTISRDELRVALALGGPSLLDVGPAALFPHSHLPGAVHVVPRRARKVVPRLVADPMTPVVVYGLNSRADEPAVVASTLRAIGYTDVRRYPGGMQDWARAGLPLSSAGPAERVGPLPDGGQDT
jgi:rhodanese-related sulfurtransferase